MKVENQTVSLGHDYETKKVASTCSTKGYIHSVCKRCGGVHHKELSLNPKVHEACRVEVIQHPEKQMGSRDTSFTGYVYVCTEEKYYCKGCGEYMYTSWQPPDSVRQSSYMRADECARVLESKGMTKAAEQILWLWNYYLEHNA